MSQIMTESKASVEDHSFYVAKHQTKTLVTKKKEKFKDKIRQIVLMGDLSRPKTTQEIFNSCGVESEIKLFYEAIWELEDEGGICRRRTWTRNLILRVTWLPGENNS